LGVVDVPLVASSRIVVSLQAVTQEIEERSVKLKLTIVDTPGFGDSINNENSWAKAVEYIDAQFHSYLEQVCCNCRVCWI
jgi:septin 7